MDQNNNGSKLYGFNLNSLGNRSNKRYSAMSRDLWERSPYLSPVSVTKGTLLTTKGGVADLQSSTGGTTLFTVDPETGTVTIAGGVVVNQVVNFGTAQNTTFTGSVTNTGTLTIGIGTAGTIYNSNWSGGTVGSANVVGGTITGVKLEYGTIPSYITFNVSAGSRVLASPGNLELQTYGTSLVIAVNLGGTTFRFTPSGTI